MDGEGGLQGACFTPWQEGLGVIHRELAWVREGGRGWAVATRYHSSYLPTQTLPSFSAYALKGRQVQVGQLVLRFSGGQGSRAVCLGGVLSPLDSSRKLSWAGSVFDQGPSLLSQKSLSESPPSCTVPVVFLLALDSPGSWWATCSLGSHRHTTD